MRWILRSGGVVARRMMKLSSWFDHQLHHGNDAARFVQSMRTMLRAPAPLFVEWRVLPRTA